MSKQKKVLQPRAVHRCECCISVCSQLSRCVHAWLNIERVLYARSYLGRTGPRTLGPHRRTCALPSPCPPPGQHPSSTPKRMHSDHHALIPCTLARTTQNTDSRTHTSTHGANNALPHKRTRNAHTPLNTCAAPHRADNKGWGNRAAVTGKVSRQEGRGGPTGHTYILVLVRVPLQCLLPVRLLDLLLIRIAWHVWAKQAGKQAGRQAGRPHRPHRQADHTHHTQTNPESEEWMSRAKTRLW
jgi:hypothetical protein